MLNHRSNPRLNKLIFSNDLRKWYVQLVDGVIARMDYRLNRFEATSLSCEDIKLLRLFSYPIHPNPELVTLYEIGSIVAYMDRNKGATRLWQNWRLYEHGVIVLMDEMDGRRGWYYCLRDCRGKNPQSPENLWNRVFNNRHWIHIATQST